MVRCDKVDLLMTKALTFLFQRDIDRVIEELKLYTNESDIWKIGGDIKNSAGNLALHLAGNLQHFIGADLGRTGYIRDREFEFSGRVNRDELIKQLETAKQVINDVLPALTPEILQAAFPGKIPLEATTEGFLLHLYNHFGYHHGQINYHRRLLAC
jgi:hypothetical protein